MKSNNILNALITHLSQKPSFDGRLLVIASLIGYFLIIIIAHYYFGSYIEFWKKLGVPAMNPTFYDLRVITAGLDSFQQGNDPLAVFPKTWYKIGTMFNYPRIWYYFSYLGLGQKQTVVAGFVLAITFYLTVFTLIKKLNLAESIIYSLFLCSPVVMFFVERGNSDIVIFVLLAFAIFNSDKKGLAGALSYLFFMLSCFLKLYPIFSLPFFLKHRPPVFIISSAALVILFSLYVFNIQDELTLISKATPRGTTKAFGSFVFADNFTINDTEAINATNHIKKVSDVLDQPTIKKIKHAHTFVITLMALSAIFIYITAKQKPLSHSLDVSRIDSLRIGACIYVGVYLLGNNWDYRFTFLIFTLPQIINWCKTSNPFTYISLAALAGIIISSWNQIIYKVFKRIFQLNHHYFMALGLEECINYLLFLYFLYVLIQTLPGWVKEKLFIGSFKTNHEPVTK